MRFSDLSCKQVVDMKTGRVIGKVRDLCFLEQDYVIKEFYVSPPPSCIKRLFPFLFPIDEITVRRDRQGYVGALCLFFSEGRIGSMKTALGVTFFVKSRRKPFSCPQIML